MTCPVSGQDDPSPVLCRIDYPSGQDGVALPALCPAREWCFCFCFCFVLFCFVLFCFVLFCFVCLFVFWYNKSFIDQAYGVKMAGYFIYFYFYLFFRIYLFIYFGVFMDLKSISSIKTFKRSWPISSYLDRTSLVNNPCIYITFRRDSRLHDLFFYSVYSMSWIWLSLWVAY